MTKQLRLSYCEQSEPPKSPPQFIEGMPAGQFAYTGIRLNSPAKEFTEDLYFSPVEKTPPGIAYARLINSALTLVLLLIDVGVIAVLSYISAVLAGLILFRHWKSYAVLGLANLATILGVRIAIRRSSTPKRFVVPSEDEPRGSEWRVQGEKTEVRGKPKRFLLLFTIFFVLCTIVLQQLLNMPL